VYDLVTKCFYDTKLYPEYSILRKYRKILLANKNSVEVTDFRAESRVFKLDTREIFEIAKTTKISFKRAKLLFRVVNYLQPKTILKIGTSLGLATSTLSLGNPKAKITTLEGCPETLNQCQCQLQKFNGNNIECINTEHYQLIYLDGNHSKQATLDYFELLLPTITNETVWIFDGIYWSSETEEAWTIIKNHPKITVTIDTFQWGIVFFRKEQEKEHFTIRI